MSTRREPPDVNLMRPGTRLWFRNDSDGQAPWLAPPTGLVIVQVGLLSWLALQLGIVLLDESLAADLEDSLMLMAQAVVFGALLPILVAYGIAKNWAWARAGILVTTMGICSLVGWYFGVHRLEALTQLWFLLAMAIFIFGLAWYLYGSHRVRNFYSVLAGEAPVKPDSDAISDDAARPSRAMGSLLQSILEYAVVLTGLLLVVSALIQAYW